MNPQKLTAHKAWSGGGSGFLAMLFAPVGAAPDGTYAIVVLLSALFSPWTGAAIDADLLQQAVKALWAAVFAGVGVHQAVYWTPNKLKDLLPLVAGALNARGARTEESAKPGGAGGSGGSAASIAPLLCAGLVAAMLLGCGAAPEGQLEDLAPRLKPEEKSPAQAVADRLFSEAVGPEHRGVRLCMIASGVVEVMTDRVTHGDTDYADKAAGQVMRIKAVLANLDTSAGNIWFETDVKIVTLELASVIVESTKSRAANLIGNFGGGVNVLGVLDRAGIAARQAALADGIVRDVRRVVADIGSVLTAEEATAGCAARIEKNRKRIGAILGEI
jgi:hypothetical protein